MAVIFGIGAFQAFIFALLLLTKKGRKTSDKFLAGFFIVLSLYLLHIVSFTYNIWRKFPDIIFIITLIPLFYGPLLYFYVRSLIGKVITKTLLLLHFLPIINTYLMILPFVFETREIKLLYFTGKYIDLPYYFSVEFFIQHLSAPFYFTWIIIVLKKNNSRLKQSHSSLENINLKWMQNLLIGAISLWVIDTINVYLLNYTYLEIPGMVSWSIKLGFVVFTLIIGFYGLRQGDIFVSQPEKVRNNNDKKNLNLSGEKAESYAQSINKYISEDKPYLNNELRIQDLSVQLKIPSHHISFVINEIMNQNFYDFVNSHRIKEAKQRLVDPKYQNFTIVAIAFDCGFNSKATFNRLFKQYTGTTPSQFRKEK